MLGLVTGATGFIGGHLVRALLADGWSVRALARPTSSREHLSDLSVQWVEGDLRDKNAVRSAVSDCDGVFHVGALYALWSARPQAFDEINVGGTKNVLEAAREAGVRRVVHTSTVACIGQAPRGTLANEDTPGSEGDVTGDYERTKLAAERLALQAAASGQDVVVVNPASTIGPGQDVVVVNPASTIGPGDRGPTPTGKIITDFMAGRMPFTLDTALNFVDVRDVARGHVLAFEKGQSARRYILGNERGNKSLHDFLQLVGAVAGRRAPRFRLPYGLAWAAGAASTLTASITGRPPRVPLNGVRIARHRMQYDPARAIAELGLPQTPLEATVQDAVSWFRAHGGAH